MVGRRMYLAACVGAATLLVGGDRLCRAQAPVPVPGPVAAPAAAAPMAGAVAGPMAGTVVNPLQGDPRAVAPGFAPRGGMGTTPYLGNTRGMGGYSVNYAAPRYQVSQRARPMYARPMGNRRWFRRWRWR